MSTLLVDVGNSRLKCAVLEPDGPGAVHAGPHRDGAREWQQALARAAAVPPARVLVANVAGPAFAAGLDAWLRAEWSQAAEYVVATAAAGGVRNAYARPAALGVDRWLAMIGARRRVARACVIVNAGTACTIDLLDADGRHRGGAILPGVRLMEEALYLRTGDVARARAAESPALADSWGVNTAGAVLGGGALALATLAERAVADLGGAGHVALFLTGGDAARLGPLLRPAHEHVPDLVLRGLAVLAAEAGA